MSNSTTANLDIPHAKKRLAQSPQARALTGPVRPLVSALSAIAISGALVATIFLTKLNMEWVTFLAGILVAALLAEATRLSRAEWALMRRTAQLAATRDKLDKETRARKNAEAHFSSAQPRLHLIDDVLPTMVLFADADGRCRYHNHAVRNGLLLRREQIDGMHLNEVLGPMVYQEISAYVRQALAGQTVTYYRNQKLGEGSVRKLGVMHVPQYAEGGRVTGFYMLMDDVTEHAEVLAPIPAPAPAAVAAQPAQLAMPGAAPAPAAAQHDERADMIAAIEKNEFRLFSQRIAPLSGNTGRAEFHEILVRLMEEEEGLIPPGAFFPLVEEFGMMSRLDRWVVQHVAEWVALQVQQRTWPQGSIYFINLSEATIADAGFGDYLEVTLKAYGISGGTLCFEIPATDLVTENAALLTAFARRIARTGAHIAVSGCGHGEMALDKVPGFRPDFVKIDGSTLLSRPSDPAALAKVNTVNQNAKRNGMKTIAEMVESQQVLDKLREIGVDFAQGFGISQPRPLADKTAGPSAPATTGGARSPLMAGGAA